MVEPKLGRIVPYGQPGDEDWVSVGEAIYILQCNTLAHKGWELSHEEAEALLNKAVDGGHVRTRPEEIPIALGGHIRYTQYSRPDIEKLFTTEEPVPVVERPAETAVAPSRRRGGRRKDEKTLRQRGLDVKAKALISVALCVEGRQAGEWPRLYPDPKSLALAVNAKHHPEFANDPIDGMTDFLRKQGIAPPKAESPPPLKGNAPVSPRTKH
jgi:hypothetical protein